MTAPTSNPTSPQTQLIHKGDGLQVVVGLGGSGLSAVNYLVKNGYQVAVTDGGDPLILKERLKDKLPENVATYFGKIDGDLLATASRIVISPGIDPFLPVFNQAREKNIPIVSDIQLFHEICHARNIPIVAITGSNAKSTVTTLVGEMAQNACQFNGEKVGVGGNLGTPALDLLSDGLNGEKLALAVLELSSFQLQTTTDLQAQVATVLNMSPDHLDRHGDMLGYHQAKHRIFQGVKSIVVNRDDPLSRPLVADNTPVITFGSNAPDINQYGLITEGNGDIWLARGKEKLIHENDIQIKGQHNLLNVLSALALGELAGLPMDDMLATLKGFAGLPHRCQFITTSHGLDCFDDSKGTNIGSTIAAILGLGKVYQPKGKKLAVILGGQGKGQDFSPLAHPLLTYAKKIYLIGEDSEKIRQNLSIMGISSQENGDSTTPSTSTTMQSCGTLENAINQAWQDAKMHPDLGVLLLSPACASLDQFSNYAERGKKFVELVMK